MAYRDEQHDGGGRDDVHVLSVRLNPSLHQIIRRLARQDGETVASTIRGLLRQGVEHREQVAR